MFTGIIESLGTVRRVTQAGNNIHFDIESSLVPELKIDQSVSHNGVCLTVVDLDRDTYRVTAISETLQKTNLGDLKPGHLVNLERCMPANGRFDGHIVQGHVDQTGILTEMHSDHGSWIADFEYDGSRGNLTVEKGSICINGISLTCFRSGEGRFRVAIIPYTYAHTTFHVLQAGDRVNLEFDVIGKYVQRILKGY